MASHPIELILARNLISELTLAALLSSSDGEVVFFNDAAGEILGRRFEDLGPLTAEQWDFEFGPREESLQPGWSDLLPHRAAEPQDPPDNGRAHLELRGKLVELGFVRVPISTIEGFRGAILLLWPVAGDGRG
jgi:PAS domain-containing protein